MTDSASAPTTDDVAGTPAEADDVGEIDRGHSRGPALLLALGVFAAALTLTMLFDGPLRHWFAWHTGILHAGPDVYYNFWSGFGSDLGEATLIGSVSLGVYTGVRKVNCHVKGCWRIGHHPLEGTPYTLCKTHHPHVPAGGASHGHILEQYRRHIAAREAHANRDDKAAP
jgi:hypothetical protein